jgi:isocitrate dehydrogenase (NADP) (EC 1.1.1.42)
MEKVFAWSGKAVIPQEGQFIKLREDKSLQVPNNPIIPYIEGRRNRSRNCPSNDYGGK